MKHFFTMLSKMLFILALPICLSAQVTAPCGSSVTGSIGTSFTFTSSGAGNNLNSNAHVDFVSSGGITTAASNQVISGNTITFKAPSVAATGTYTVNIYKTSGTNVSNRVCQFSFVYVSLPIELVSFKANSIDKYVSLKWNTAEEKNVNFFSLERSKNGRDFKEIAKVKTGADSKEYNFVDEKPFAGTSYYRLAMAENDGSAINYSKTVSVSMSTKGALKVSPTLSSSAVTVDLPENLGEITLNVTDIAGKVIKSFKTTSVQETLNVSDLANGMYFIVAQSGTDKFSERFVKQ